MGFKQSPSDPCLFVRKNEQGVCFVLCYVNDNLTIGDERAIKATVEEIQKYSLNVTVEEQLTDHPSCEVVLSKDK